MSRPLARAVRILSAIAALVTFSAVPAGASGTGPTTVNFTQNTGTVTVAWGGGYTGPMLGLYPVGTTCPTAGIGDVPTAPTFSMGLSASTSPVIVSLSTSVISPGWGPGSLVPVTSGTYNFCMYNITYGGFFVPLPFFNLVNPSGWVGTVTATGPPSTSDPSLPAPPTSPAPPGEDDPTTTPAPQRVTPSFTG